MKSCLHGRLQTYLLDVKTTLRAASRLGITA